MDLLSQQNVPTHHTLTVSTPIIEQGEQQVSDILSEIKCQFERLCTHLQQGIIILLVLISLLLETLTIPNSEFYRLNYRRIRELRDRQKDHCMNPKTIES